MVKMEMNKEKRKGSFPGFIFLKAFPALILLAAVAYTVVYTLSVRNKVHEWQNKVESGKDTAALSPEEWMLLREKAYLNARLTMAANDSLGLTINLRDSVVQLETKGVVLRQVKFADAEIPNFFRSFHPSLYVKTFSKPFKISEFGGTIVKEPITVVKAPKDSIEAARNKTEIDTSTVEFVEWHMLLNKSFVISFVQSDSDFEKMDKSAWNYRFDRYTSTLTSNVKDMVQFKIPVYYPQITLYIPKSEAKSFYRALSKKGVVVMRL
jgi:hypothetical protein